MRQGFGDYHRDFDQAGDFAVAAPGRLVYHLVPAVFLDGIGIALSRREHVAYDAL